MRATRWRGWPASPAGCVVAPWSHLPFGRLRGRLGGGIASGRRLLVRRISGSHGGLGTRGRLEFGSVADSFGCGAGRCVIVEIRIGIDPTPLRKGQHDEDEQDDHLQPQPAVTARAVEQNAKLRRDDGSGPLVVLNACQLARGGDQLTGSGGFAKAFLATGAAAYVAALWSIHDTPAHDFVTELYTPPMVRRTVVYRTVTDFEFIESTSRFMYSSDPIPDVCAAILAVLDWGMAWMRSMNACVCSRAATAPGAEVVPRMAATTP